MDWFNKLFKKPPQASDIARDRLKLVLISDRNNCRPDILEMMKNDIMKVLLNYMDIDEDELDINIAQQQVSEGDGPVPVLYANIPIKNMRKQPPTHGH